MSSLKNFVQLMSNLNAQWSAYPAVDLRFFFLQHKYSSLLHFSKDRINEAATFRRKIQQLFEGIAVLEELTSTYEEGGGRGVPKKSNEMSSNLLHCLIKCKEEVRHSLADDFDTPTAISSISSLILETNNYKSFMLKALEKKDNILPMEPILSVKQYLVFIFEILGIPANVLDIASSKGRRATECR